MTPLQRVAMGLIIVVVPAPFPRDPEPAWAFYDALPAPLGWALVVWGVAGLRRLHRGDGGLDLPWWLAWLALAVSVPLWFPQMNHLFTAAPATGADAPLVASFQWFLFLPQAAFSLVLARRIGEGAVEVEDRYAVPRFGVLTWAFGAVIVLPVIAYGGGIDWLVQPTLVTIGLVNLGFIFYLFRVHARPWLATPPARPAP